MKLQNGLYSLSNCMSKMGVKTQILKTLVAFDGDHSEPSYYVTSSHVTGRASTNQRPPRQWYGNLQLIVQIRYKMENKTLNGQDKREYYII